MASSYTKPIENYQSDNVSFNIDSISVRDSSDNQEITKSASVITKPVNEKLTSLNVRLGTDRISNENSNHDKLTSDNTKHSPDLISPVTPVANNTTARQLFKPLDDIDIGQNTDDSSKLLKLFEPLDDIDIGNNTDDSSELLIQDQPNPYNNVTKLFNLNSTETNCVDQGELKMPLYAPDWYISEMVSTELRAIVNSRLLKRNWITQDLAEEIQSKFPTRDEIITNSVTGACERDLNAFKVKCEAMFPVGRVFMSFTQLVQSTKHFLTGWNVQKVHGSKKIRCFYGKNANKKPYKSTCDVNKRRKVEPRLKSQYQCPFEIKYSFLDVKVVALSAVELF